MSGDISSVRLELAGMGTRRFRLANLPPEISSATIRSVLSPYGEIKLILEENWSKHYRYAVSNGIRIVTMTLTISQIFQTGSAVHRYFHTITPSHLLRNKEPTRKKFDSHIAQMNIKGFLAVVLF
jgi:hypothetical protein